MFDVKSLRNPKWRRRESNAAPQSPIDVAGQQVTTREADVSAHCLLSDVTDCQELASIDPILARIAEIWPTLPKSIREQAESLCLQLASSDSAD